MQIKRLLSSTLSPAEFLRHLARDLVRHAAEAEGLEHWFARHGASRRNPGIATRRYCHDQFGDDDHAYLLNTVMVLEVDRRMTAAS